MRHTIPTITFSLLLTSAPLLAAPPDAAKSADAVKALKVALDAHPATLTDLAGKDFAAVALTKADAATARDLLWQAHVALIRKDRAAEVKDRVLKEDKLSMPFFYKLFGEKPAGGRSLWISMHGGGNAPARTNDQQYQNQQRLYTLSEGVYLAPRAPTNTWNLWHEPHIDRFFTRLIEDLVVLEDVNPDRVYILGYSAGGDGVWQMGPRMADSWAAAAMMAGHPNGVSLLSLRNCPFFIQCGGNDAAYNRNKVCAEFGEQLDKLQKADPFGYVHGVKIHEGKPHWMGGEDKDALPWMAKFTRDPVPDKVVWKQTGTPKTRFYWLAVPKDEAAGDSLVVATRKGQVIDVSTAEKVKTLQIRLDDRMVDLDKPVTVKAGGKDVFTGEAKRTIGTLVTTLVGRGDPRMMFDAEVSVAVAGK